MDSLRALALRFAPFLEFLALARRHALEALLECFALLRREIAARPARAAGRRTGRAAAGLRHLDLGALADAIDAVGDDDLAGSEALLDRGVRAFRGARGHRPDLHRGVVLH